MDVRRKAPAKIQAMRFRINMRLVIEAVAQDEKRLRLDSKKAIAAMIKNGNCTV